MGGSLGIAVGGGRRRSVHGRVAADQIDMGLCGDDAHRCDGLATTLATRRGDGFAITPAARQCDSFATMGLGAVRNRWAPAAARGIRDRGA
ncbi:hypothetical protein TIFTF001_003766 [Ficus carica]|uniref:Uncharacterized protein n=1 Tax=Ficus carica TaxID=3494 RepID=A0AA87ZT27_FICCA|nr:hypothetical protein TIFTF001_003766 [Ficus carica]